VPHKSEVENIRALYASVTVSCCFLIQKSNHCKIFPRATRTISMRENESIISRAPLETIWASFRQQVAARATQKRRLSARLSGYDVRLWLADFP